MNNYSTIAARFSTGESRLYLNNWWPRNNNELVWSLRNISSETIPSGTTIAIDFYLLRNTLLQLSATHTTSSFVSSISITRNSDSIEFILHSTDGKSYSIDLYRNGYVSSQGKNLYMAAFSNDNQFAQNGEMWRIQSQLSASQSVYITIAPRITLRTNGVVCVVYFNWNGYLAADMDSYLIVDGKVPEQYRPKEVNYCVLTPMKSNGHVIGYVDADGNVGIRNFGTSTNYAIGQIVYFCK